MMKRVRFTSVLFVLLILDTITISTKAQFFTKTSKSIPRMGRRADNLLSEQEDGDDGTGEQQVDKDRESMQALKAIMSNLAEIPKFIQDSVLFYQRKLRKRSRLSE